MKESCTNCLNYSLCFLRKNLDDYVIEKGCQCNLLNIDGDIREGRFTDLYYTLAKCCISYKLNK